MQQTGPVQFAENAHHATGPVHVFHMVFLGGRGHFRQTGHLAAQTVDIGHGEVHFAFQGRRQQVQYRVGRTAHGNIQAHGVFEGLHRGDIAWQYCLHILFVVQLGQIHDAPARFQEQFAAVRVGGQQGAVTGQGQTQSFGQAVHGVGGEHAGAGTAGGAGGALHFVEGFLVHAVIGGHHHGVYQVQLALGQLGLARFHGAAGHEDHRDIQAHGGHQHAGGDLVAVGNAHQRIGAVGVDHVLHGVGNDVPAGQGIEHAVMAHGDAVVHRNGIEFLGDAPGLLHLAGHQLAHVLQVHVPGYELGKGVGDGNNRFTEVPVLHARGAPQGTGAGHVTAMGGGAGAILRHGNLVMVTSGT